MPPMPPQRDTYELQGEGYKLQEDAYPLAPSTPADDAQRRRERDWKAANFEALRRQGERALKAREQEAAESERAAAMEKALRMQQEAIERRAATREHVHGAAAWMTSAFGSLPFVGGAARIINAGLSAAQKDDQRAQRQGAPDRDSRNASAEAATMQTRAAAAAERAAGEQSRAGKAVEKAGTQLGGASVMNLGAMGATAAAEFIRYGLGGVAKYSPATAERLNYQTDRLQAGVGRMFEPLVRGATNVLEKVSDAAFGKGFQLNYPQISGSATEIRDRLQLQAAAGAANTSQEGASGFTNNPKTSGYGAGGGAAAGAVGGFAVAGPIGALAGAFLGATIGDQLEEMVGGSREGHILGILERGSRGRSKVYE